MGRYESETIEFKSEYTRDIYKEVIAFANTSGGILYVGIDDSGEIHTLEDMDDTYTRITNGIRDAILPDVTMFIRYIRQEDGVIRIEVSEGSYKPYYLKEKGLKPSGVFVRQGASSVPASREMIRQMIKETDGDEYESMRSPEQELTFQYAEKVFDRNGAEWDITKFPVLGLTNPVDGQYTNLAVLLSDQCPFSVKTARFSDLKKTEFADTREFSGSVLRQMDEVYYYLNALNRKRWIFTGDLAHQERWDYPAVALREAMINAIIHRDYNYRASTIININEREMEFISLGGLMPGLSEAEIRIGVSVPRNRNLANIFYRIREIEFYGSGLRKIFEAYRDCPIEPQLVITPNAFKIILPNQNHAADQQKQMEGMRQGEWTARETIVPFQRPLSSQKKKILLFLQEHGSMGENDVQALLGVRRTRAYTIMRELFEEGYIQIIGRGSDKIYVLSDRR